MTLKLGIQDWVFKYYQVCSNDVSGLTFTHLTVLYAFVWGKKYKTMDFSETIVVYYIKVSRWRQLNESFMSTIGQGYSLILVHITQIQYFLTSFPQ